MTTAPSRGSDVDPPAINPGAFETYLARYLSDGGLIEFESAPAGWLTPKGEVRKRDHRAYFYRAPGADKRQRMPSVTTLLDQVLPKGGLTFWSEARGIEGAIEAVRLGEIDPQDPASVASAVDTVRSLRLGADAARDKAATRGLNVHGILEHWMKTGEYPNPADHLPEHHGYIQGLVRWLLKANPEPIEVEQLVVHPERRYAGRYDLRARIDGKDTLVDLKSQERGQIFPAAHAQLQLYRLAAIESGEPDFDALSVVVVADNGEFREMECVVDEQAALRALEYAACLSPVTSACEKQNRLERKARVAA